MTQLTGETGLKSEDRQQYSQWMKLAALDELERNGGNVYSTAKQVGIPPQRLSDWAKAKREGRLPTIQPALSVDAPLDERFEHVAYQLVAAMTEKLGEANLHQITEALKFVFDKLGHTEEDDGSDVYEKLADLINRYAADGTADGDPEPFDESSG